MGLGLQIGLQIGLQNLLKKLPEFRGLQYKTSVLVHKKRFISGGVMTLF